MLFVAQALSNDAAFVRVRKGVYALRALAGNVGPVPHNTPKSSRPPLGRGWDHRDSYRSVSSSHVCPYQLDADIFMSCIIRCQLFPSQTAAMHEPG